MLFVKGISAQIIIVCVPRLDCCFFFHVIPCFFLGGGGGGGGYKYLGECLYMFVGEPVVEFMYVCSIDHFNKT